MKFNDTTYDRLKFVVLIALPALAALYLGLGQIWHFPKLNEVGTSIGIIAAFLGTLLQISNSKFKSDDEADGSLDYVGVNPDTGIPDLKLTTAPHVAGDPAKVLKKGYVKLNVSNHTGQQLKKLEAPTEDIEEH